MLLRATLLFALVACSSPNAPAPVQASRYPIVPDTVMLQLGDIGFALAVDLHGLRGAAIESLVPASLTCARDILRTAKIAVVTKGTETWEGRITGIAEAKTQECATAIGDTLGISVSPTNNHTATIDLPGKAAVITWRGDDALVSEHGARIRSGPTPGVITDLVATVPRSARGWVVTSGIPAQHIRSVVAWLNATATTWTITVNAVSSEMGAAKPWIDSIVSGFTAAAEAAQIRVEAAWFAVEATPTTAQLVATIPLAAFVPTR